MAATKTISCHSLQAAVPNLSHASHQLVPNVSVMLSQHGVRPLLLREAALVTRSEPCAAACGAEANRLPRCQSALPFPSEATYQRISSGALHLNPTHLP